MGYPSRNVRTKKQVYRFILNRQRLHEFLFQNNNYRWQWNPAAIVPSAGERFSGNWPLEWHWGTSEQHSTAPRPSQSGNWVMLSLGGETAKNRWATGPGLYRKCTITSMLCFCKNAVSSFATWGWALSWCNTHFFLSWGRFFAMRELCCCVTCRKSPILDCMTSCLRRRLVKEQINICTWWVATAALVTREKKSLLVADCVEKMTALSEENQVTTMWEPWRSGIQQNETASRLARERARIRLSVQSSL